MSETCGRCGRRLKNPVYIEVGYVKTCAAKLGIVLPSKRKQKTPPEDPAQVVGKADEGR